MKSGIKISNTRLAIIKMTPLFIRKLVVINKAINPALPPIRLLNDPVQIMILCSFWRVVRYGLKRLERAPKITNRQISVEVNRRNLPMVMNLF